MSAIARASVTDYHVHVCACQPLENNIQPLGSTKSKQTSERKKIVLNKKAM